MKKRLLSILLCFCMVLSLLPTTVLAAGPNVGIGMTTLTSGKYYTISGDAVTELDSAPVNDGYLYYTLDGTNAVLTVTGDVSYSGTIPALSISDSNLTLTGSGNLSMTSSSTPAVSGSSGSLTTSGYTGNLSFNSTGSNAITNCTDVTLETLGTLTLSGNSSNATIHCMNNVTLKGSTVSLTNNGSNSQLVCAFGENVLISATNGDLNLTGSTPSSPLVIADSGEQGVNGTVTLSASGNISMTNSGSGTAVVGALKVSEAQNITVASKSGIPTIGGAVDIAVDGDVHITNAGSGMTVGGLLTVSKAQNVTITSAGDIPTTGGVTNITADGDVRITNTGSGMAVGNSLAATSKNGSVTVEGKHPSAPAILATAKITAAKDITITSVSPIDIGGTATLSAVSGMVIRTTSVGTTITKDGTPISASYGGDISASGLNISGKDTSGNADPAYNAPATKTLYKAGNGYAIFTPAIADPAVNAKLELHSAVISTTSSALSLPSTGPVDITVTGDNSLSVTEGYGNAINTNGQALTVTGSGNLTLKCSHFGISVNGIGAVSIDINGDLTFDTAQQPIYTNTDSSDITVSAKSITSKSGYYFNGKNVQLTAKDGDIVFDETGKSNIYYKISASGDIVLNAPNGKIDIAQSNYQYALYSSNGKVTVTALNDVTINAASQGAGISASYGPVSVTSQNGSINMNCNTTQCVYAGGTVTLSAAKDITLNSNGGDSLAAISAFDQTVDINAGGKLSSTSAYGFIVGALTVKADEVSVTGIVQNGVQANSVTITNPDGGNCKNVNIVATSSYDSCAAINSPDITVKANNLFICGNKSAKAINASGNVNIGNAGLIVGTYSIAGTNNIAAGVVRGQNGGDISTSGLDLSTPPTDSTVYTAGNGYALYRPVSGETPATLTLHNASIDVDTKGSALKLGKNTVLQLEGTNSITNSSQDQGTEGIQTSNGFWPVTIQGGSSDSLTISAWCCTSVGDLTVSGGTVSMYGSVYGMVAEGNVILKNGAQVSVTGGNEGGALVVEQSVSVTVEDGSSLTVNGDASITSNITVSGGSTLTVDSNLFYVDADINVSGSDSKLTVNSGSSLETGGTITLGSDAALENNGAVSMKLGTTVEQIKLLKLTGMGVVRVVTATDPQYGSPTAWDSYTNDGVAITELRAGLDLTTGDHSGKTVANDGYSWDGNILTLGDKTYISGGVTLPDTATINTSANSTINGSISLASNAACDLVFSGTGSLTVVGNIGNGLGGTMTVSGGLKLIVNGSVNIGTSGGANGTLNVTGAGTTLSASSSQGSAVFFETVKVGKGASLIAKAEENGSIGVQALSGGVTVTDGSTLTTGCDYGVYITDGKLTVDESSKLITNGSVAPFCIVDKTSSKSKNDVLALAGIPNGTEIASVKGTDVGYGYTYWSLVPKGGSLSVNNENSTPVTLKGAVSGQQLNFVKMITPGGDPVDPGKPSNPVDPGNSSGNGNSGNGSSGSGSSSSVSYTLTFETNGGSKISSISKTSGTTIDLSAYVATRDGYDFECWYSNAALTEKITNVTLIKNTTVYAKWTEKPAKARNPFTDVSESAYYHDAVLWAVQKSITSGTSNTAFSPDMVCTRAQMVTFMWKTMGSPEPTIANCPFIDVSKDAYYYKAVLWAVEKRITAGTSSTTFSPNATVTRGQTVTFLWNTAGKPSVTSVNPFTDVSKNAYYNNAALWAAEKGITHGTSDVTFSPSNPCTRAQIVTFMYRYMEN